MASPFVSPAVQATHQRQAGNGSRRTLAAMLACGLLLIGCQSEADIDGGSLPDTPDAILDAMPDGQPTLDVVTNPDQDTCGASRFANRIGTPADELKLPDTPVRVLGPKDAATMDFNPKRLNFNTDLEGQILRIYCG